MQNSLPYLLIYTFGEYYVWNFNPSGNFDKTVGTILKDLHFQWKIPEDYWNYTWSQFSNGHCTLAGIIAEPALYSQCKWHYKHYLELDPMNKSGWRSDFAKDLDIIIEIEKMRQKTLIDDQAPNQTRNFHSAVIIDDTVSQHTGVPLRKMHMHLVMTPVQDGTTKFFVENEELEIYSVFTEFK